MLNLSALAGQKTTAAGISLALTTLSAVANGQMTWHQAVPVLVGCAVLILYPENTALRISAQALATDAVQAGVALAPDVAHIVDAYRMGVAHGSAAQPAPAAPVLAPAAPAPAAPPTAAAAPAAVPAA